MQTVSGLCSKFFRFLRNYLFFTIVQHSTSQRMFTARLQCGCSLKQLPAADAIRRTNVRHLRLPFCDRTCLVQYHYLGFSGSLQRSSRLKQDAIFCANTISHHNGHRCSQTQRAGTADHQNSNTFSYSKSKAAAQNQPDQHGDQGNGHDNRHEYTGYFICNLGNGSLCGRSIADHPDDF